MPSEVTKSKAKVRADPADVTANAFEVTVEPSVPPYPPNIISYAAVSRYPINTGIWSGDSDYSIRLK